MLLEWGSILVEDFKIQVHMNGSDLERIDILSSDFFKDIQTRHMACGHIIDLNGEPIVYKWGNIHTDNIGKFVKAWYKNGK